LNEALAAMTEDSGRTRVCSVLFIDIVDYSKRDVTEQVRLKQRFNLVMASALGHVEPDERVVVDTGDGAAITFLGDPERALYVALEVFDNVGELPVRMGINLGPVSLMKDLNGLDNVIGDGINVAQRIMSFAQSGELLVSRVFYDVVSLLSEDYASMFRAEGTRADKHNRPHDLYSVSKAVRVGRKVATEQLKAKRKRRAGPDSTFQPIERTPAQVFDAGTHYMVSGYSEASVNEAVQKLAAKGCKLISPISRVGSKWLASVDNPKLAVEARVEELGFKRIISGPTKESVELKLRDLVGRGSTLVQPPELADGVWTAICEQL
jgi:class 3 adenylate cyclase